MAKRNNPNEPVLMMGSIQSDLLLGHSKKAEALVFFKILHEQPFKHFIRNMPFTSAAAVYRPNPEKDLVATATGAEPPDTRYAVAFTNQGLTSLQAREIDTLPKTDPFVQGMAKRANLLNDTDPNTWVVGNPKQTLHGVFIVTGSTKADVDRGLHLHFTDFIHGFKIVEVVRGEVRPKENEGREHFGFLDGVSQPALRGFADPMQEYELHPSLGDDLDQGLPGQDLLWPGEFVFGYASQRADAKTFTEKGDPSVPPLPFMVNGAYLVIRRLQQFVPEMHADTRAEAARLKLDHAKLETQLVGRWPSGAPLLNSPDVDDPDLGKDPMVNNKFEFGGDRKGVTCPWAAHIRKAYPRDDVPTELNPKEGAVDEEEARTQTHRMLRRGIQFGPEVTEAEKKIDRTIEQRGLIFKCYVTSIEEQFEFVQRAWVNSASFVQEGSGMDAIIGQAPGEAKRPFAGAGEPGAKPQASFAQWVKMTGGEYFFAPSIDFLRSLR